MRVTVLLGHPYEDSFNAAIAHAVVAALTDNGHIAVFHDLNGEGFDPVLRGGELAGGVTDDPLVLRHQREIREADGIIVIHPNWWGQPPAILKGWVDRVLRENVAYRFPAGDSGGGLPIGLLKAGVGLVFNTSNTPEERENSVFGDPLERIWKDCIFAFCGVASFERVMFRVVADSDPAERTRWLNEVRQTVDRHFPAADG